MIWRCPAPAPVLKAGSAGSLVSEICQTLLGRSHGMFRLIASVGNRSSFRRPLRIEPLHEQPTRISSLMPRPATASRYAFSAHLHMLASSWLNTSLHRASPFGKTANLSLLLRQLKQARLDAWTALGLACMPALFRQDLLGNSTGPPFAKRLLGLRQLKHARRAKHQLPRQCLEMPRAACALAFGSGGGLKGW